MRVPYKRHVLDIFTTILQAKLSFLCNFWRNKNIQLKEYM